MAHFNFVISQNAKWGHAGFYIDCHRMTVPENILLRKKHSLQLATVVSCFAHALSFSCIQPFLQRSASRFCAFYELGGAGTLFANNQRRRNAVPLRSKAL